MSDKEKDAKLKVLELTLGKLEKSYGKGVVMKLGDKIAEDIEVIPTGSIGLDLALGVGGYPRGRVIEIYGPEKINCIEIDGANRKWIGTDNSEN